MKLIVVLLSVVVLVNAVPIPEETSGFARCRDEYNTIVAGLKDIRAMDTAWRLFFNYLDLDSNKIITGSEIAVRLQENGALGNKTIIEAASEAESWIASEENTNGHFEVFKKDFEVVINKAIDGKVSNEFTKTRDVTENICTLFVHMLPRIKWNMEELLRCNNEIIEDERKIFEDLNTRIEQNETKKATVTQGAINTWEAVFATIDKNNDKVLEIQELKGATNLPMSQASDSLLNAAFGKLIGGTSEHTDAISWNVFMKLLSKIILDNPSRPWTGLQSVEELEGRQYFCLASKHINREVIKQRNNNFDCIRVYEDTAENILGYDKIYADEIIFTIVDKDRDGMWSTRELKDFIGQDSPLFPPMDMVGYDVEYFTHYAPGHLKTVMDTADLTNETKAYQLSQMSVDELIAEEQLCTGMIKVLKKFPYPSSRTVEFLTRTEIPLTPDAEEIEEEKKYIANWEEYEGLKKSVFVSAEFMDPQDAHTAPTEFSYYEEEETTNAVDKKTTTEEISIEDLIHSALGESNPQHPSEDATDHPNEDHFAMDLRTMIKEKDDLAPEKSQDEKQQLWATLEELYTEEQLPHVEEEEEGEDHAISLTSTEEDNLRALLSQVFDGAREKEGPVIEQ